MRADAIHPIADMYAGVKFVAVNCSSDTRSCVGLFRVWDVCVGVLFRMRKSARTMAVKAAREWQRLSRERADARVSKLAAAL